MQPSTLLRFTTAGSVDDGKSTLIGRLLYDSKSIFEDQLQSLAVTSARRGETELNLSLLTDGLKAEREQGITIDVAYRYFSTPFRKFIVADTPGHLQYTRNMVTGASNAQAALILIDARQGIVEQTKRHSFIASLLQIKHLIVCVNKMDLVDYNENTFIAIKNEFSIFAAKLEIQDIQFIPVSALWGDNIVNPSLQMSWYKGSSLLYWLENIHTHSDNNLIDCRFPIQMVIRPYHKDFHDYRAYAGRVASGIFKKGDKIKILPSGYESKIKSIYQSDKEITEAYPNMSVSVCLEDNFDISRGDMLVKEHNLPILTQDIEVMLCWFSSEPLKQAGKYLIMHCHKEIKCIIKDIRYKIDINTLHRDDQNKQVAMNDIAKVLIRCTQPIMVDSYRKNKVTGSFILIHEVTNETVAAAMIW
jgi:sulfate adenylyltransferase subunit 1